MNKIAFIESLLRKEFETVPFHNLFMLNNKKIVGSILGGTCSDKVLHFRKVLSKNDIESKLHSAIINGHECHRMLSIEVDKKKYFIDVGSGWPSLKLFPSFETVEYSAFGMTFKTELQSDRILLFHKTDKEFKLMITIPLQEKDEKEMLEDIESRFKDKSVYPFRNSLRFSKVINRDFYFLKGNCLRIYNDATITEKSLSIYEISELIKNTFNFDISDLELH